MESNPPLIDCQTKSTTDLIFQKWAFPTNLPEHKLLYADRPRKAS